jgi:hypothetical protein
MAFPYPDVQQMRPRHRRVASRRRPAGCPAHRVDTGETRGAGAGRERLNDDPITLVNNDASPGCVGNQCTAQLIGF